jgi:uncharacterized cofD-like protein
MFFPAMHRDARPLRIVAFGGGTGLPILLSGLRDRPDGDVTAIVTVGDDGGSSGRLRRELGIPPPGDIRNCLAALAGERRLAHAFGHRLDSGHAVGNLIIAGLAETSGDFCAGVERAARLLDVRGAVYPAARAALRLVLHTADGAAVVGESSLRAPDGSVVRVDAAGPGSAAPAGAIAAIRSADVVVLSAGSLFTSTIAALLGRGTREALARFSGPVLYVGNLSTEGGETAGFTLADHVRAIAEHGGPRVTDVLVPTEPAFGPACGAQGPMPVEVDEPALQRMGVAVRRSPLLAVAAGPSVRHDADQLAHAVLAAAAARTADAPTTAAVGSAG